MTAPQIAAMVRSDESHVRKVIHAFNEKGFSSLDPDSANPLGLLYLRFIPADARLVSATEAVD